MFALLILPILVAGFIYCHNHPYHLYRFHRHDGQYLYINSAKYGAFSFLTASVLTLVLGYLIPEVITIPCTELSINLRIISEDIWHIFEKDALIASWLFSTSVLSLAVAYTTAKVKWKILCRKLGSKQNARLYIVSDLLKDSPLDQLLFRLSLDKNALVMISMSDRKVYVGKVISLGEPNESEGPDQEISILPVVSGYRDKDNLCVTFNTSYLEVSQDLVLVIRQDMITHASEFSFEVFENFQKSKNSQVSSNSDASDIGTTQQ